MKPLDSYKKIFFDFDGVICDSVQVKIDAFHDVFMPLGEDAALMARDYQRSFPGITRFEKIPYLYKKATGADISDVEYDRLCNSFASHVVENVIAAPLLKGVGDTLDALSNSSVECYIVSGTPDGELKEIVSSKGLADYFVSVHGSPDSKTEIVQSLLGAVRLEDALFVGDAISDYSCAVNCGIDFLGICAEENIFPESVPVISSLACCVISNAHDNSPHCDRAVE